MQMAGLTQLYDAEFLFRNNTFTSFVTSWLIRYADPKRTHPKPTVESVSDLSLFIPLMLLSQTPPSEGRAFGLPGPP